MIAYAAQFASAIAEGKPTNDVALSKEVKISRSQITRWRADDAFLDWLERTTARVFHHGRTHVLARAYGLALRGSIKHMELFLRYSGQTPAEELPTPLGGAHVDARTFMIAVPRPPGAVPENAILVGGGKA